MELDEACAGLLVRGQVAVELEAEMRLPERDVAAPPDAAVTDVGAAEVLDPLRVVPDRVAGRKVDLALRRAQVGVYEVEEALPHRALERAGPRERRRVPVLVRVLVHVERVDVREGEALGVDRLGRETVLGHRAHGKDADEPAVLVAGLPDPVDDVRREIAVEVLRPVDDADPELGIRMIRKLGPRDRAHALALVAVPEADERGKVVGEVVGHVRPPFGRLGKQSSRRAPQPREALDEAFRVAHAALLAAVPGRGLHLLHDVDAVVVPQPDELRLVGLEHRTP